MVSGITPCARECKWIVYFGETPNSLYSVPFALLRSLVWSWWSPDCCSGATTPHREGQPCVTLWDQKL